MWAWVEKEWKRVIWWKGERGEYIWIIHSNKDGIRQTWHDMWWLKKRKEKRENKEEKKGDEWSEKGDRRVDVFLHQTVSCYYFISILFFDTIICWFLFVSVRICDR